MLASGTFESSLGWYPEMFLRGQVPNELGLVSFSIPTWTNKSMYPGGRDDPEIKHLEKIMSPEWFMERFAGTPCPPKGLVFSEFRNNIHVGIGGDFEFDPARDVYLMIDPGYQTAYSVLAAQKRGEELYLVDEVYERGIVTSDIIKVCMQRPWWGRVCGGASDVAATQHQGMPAPTEIWAREGHVSLSSRKVMIRDGVEAVKRYLIVNPITGRPLLHINAKCKGLLSEMGGCPNPIDGQTKVYTWKQDSSGNVIGDTPEDKNNHSCKALAYGIVNWLGFSPRTRTTNIIKFF
jgi:hypothetical protein